MLGITQPSDVTIVFQTVPAEFMPAFDTFCHYGQLTATTEKDIFGHARQPLAIACITMVCPFFHTGPTELVLAFEALCKNFRPCFRKDKRWKEMERKAYMSCERIPRSSQSAGHSPSQDTFW